ncbi:MAG TPA: vitamin K epoxide reductase family protein [Abditibacteriaceae bacterium]|jgi:uncharacterized membrane protein
MNGAKTQWANVLLGLVGCGTSAWAVHVHRLAKAGQDTGCGITDTISCDKVVTSKWAELFGIPLGFYGLMFFAVIIVAAIATKTTKATPRQFALQNLALAAVGFGGSMVLLYISKVIIGNWCPVCLSTHATTTLLFIVSLFTYLRARRLD